jgi:hypothetical protein
MNATALTTARKRFTVFAAMALTVCAIGVASSAPAANAATNTIVTGTVTYSSGARVAGASIDIFRWTSSGWALVGSATTDSRGNYRISTTQGYYNAIRAWKNVGNCIVGASSYVGWTPYYVSNGGTYNLNIVVGWYQQIC